MIENVGYLDQTKNIVTDEDFEFKKATLKFRKVVAVC